MTSIPSLQRHLLELLSHSSAPAHQAALLSAVSRARSSRASTATCASSFSTVVAPARADAHGASPAALEPGLPLALLFPGQGAQRVGMGKDLARDFLEARLVFEEVDEALKQRLSRVVWEGPEAELNRTENTQPALLAHSIAVLRVLEVCQGGRVRWCSCRVGRPPSF